MAQDFDFEEKIGLDKDPTYQESTERLGLKE